MPKICDDELYAGRKSHKLNKTIMKRGDTNLGARTNSPPLINTSGGGINQGKRLAAQLSSPFVVSQVSACLARVPVSAGSKYLVPTRLNDRLL